MSDVVLADIQKLIPAAVLIQLTDDADAGAIDETKVDQAIEDAFAEVWPYIGAHQYSVPITPTPEIVKKIVVDIAIYNLYSRKVEEIPPTRASRYANAIAQLKGIAAGTISLGMDPEPGASSTAAPETNVEKSPRIFTRDKLHGF
jgi:phage gp36-like protein